MHYPMRPTIHLNGTAKATLLAEYEDAIHLLALALRSIEAITVNGRDYYVQAPTAITQAMKEHQDRIAKVTQVREELQTIYTLIDEQGPR